MSTPAPRKATLVFGRCCPFYLTMSFKQPARAFDNRIVGGPQAPGSPTGPLLAYWGGGAFGCAVKLLRIGCCPILAFLRRLRSSAVDLLSSPKPRFALLHKRSDPLLPVRRSARFSDGVALQFHLRLQCLIPSAVQQTLGRTKCASRTLCE